MKLGSLWLALALVCAAAPAVAQQQPAPPGSGDLQAAIAAGQRGDYEEAIRLLDHGLATPGLSHDAEARFLLYRGFAYDETGQYDRAIADYSKALELRPGTPQLYYRRGIAWREKGDYAKALADLDAAVHATKKGEPDWPFLHGDRGVVLFALGRYAEAAQHFARVVKLDPSDQYAALWLHVARGRAGTPAPEDFAAAAAAAPADQWPRPLLSLFLGKATPAEVRAAAGEGEEEPRQNQECEADFFLGEYALLHHDAASARPLLQHVVATCSPSLGVHAGAAGELARLGK
jgi:lipoprotein NlpI